MLDVQQLSRSFGGVKAADDISLSFADGSLTAVIGPNGAGKSTFFNLITGALRPDSGRILLNGVDLAGRSPPEIARHGIGRAFQVASIFPTLTVHETMLAAVCADQRRASVLHRRFPLAETRDLAHARLLYDQLPAVDETLKAFIAVPSAQALQETRHCFPTSGLKRGNSAFGCCYTWFRCCYLSRSCFSACGCVPAPLHCDGGQHLNM